MPVPTDTFWNIKRLNVVFAASAVLLVAVTGWTIVQDYGAWWRIPQKDSRVWEAALVSDKIDRLDSPQLEAQIKANQQKIDDAEAGIAKQQDKVTELNQRIHDLESQSKTVEFPMNVDKANVSVDEAHLQDAITEKNQDEIDQLTAKLQEPRKKLSKETQDLENVKRDLAQARDDLKNLTKALDAAAKERNRLVADQEGLKKRLDQLAPKSAIAKLSAQIRAIPLMGFINPSERVQQVVLNDVLTDMNFQKQIPTLDRCMTCHVNIAKKDFTEEKILAYLEEQTATIKDLRLPEKWSGVTTDPLATNASPGAVAETPFWHAWAKQLAPDPFKKSVAKLKSITNLVGKNAKVTLDGRVLTTFTYDPAPQPSTQPTTQPTLNAAQSDAVLLTLLDAVLKYDGQTVDTKSDDGSVTVELSALATAQVKPVRNAAMRYADELRTALKDSLSPEQSKLLLSRYRYAMVNFVNVAREAQGRELLDPSSVLLAHPRLDLFVDVDSKHSFEAVGCTSCHDGSGQETDFVLTAHVARDIWVDDKTGEPVLANQLKQPIEQEQDFNLSNMLTVATEHVDSPKLAPTTQQSQNLDELKKQPSAAREEQTGPIAYADPVTGKTGKAVTQFKHWEEKYEPVAPRGFHLVYEEWDWPMRKPEYIEVNCARCHSAIYDIKDEAPVLFEGRYLFANLGCSNCHQMDSIPADQNRKVGTDLRHVTAKLSPAYINTWIWAPKAFRPSTKMPHFFMLENNSSTEELRRTRTEARAITEYLVKTATPLPPEHPIPAGLKGSAEAGQKVFDSVGCMGCHVNLNDPTGTKRPDGKIQTRGEQWIVADLTKKGTPVADARKRYDGMSYNERQVYAMENFEVLPGATEVAKYADGTPKPQFVHHGPELSGIGTKLTAGKTEDEARQWLFDWVKDPRHYSDYTIMPRLRLNDQQAMDLAEFLLSMKRTNDAPNDPWKAEVTPLDSDKLLEIMALQLKSKYTLTTAVKRADADDELNPMLIDALTTPATPVEDAKKLAADIKDKDEKRLIIVGKKMIANYGCMSCHMINGTETISSPCANLSDWGQKQVSKLDFGYLAEHSMGELPPTSQVKVINGLCPENVKIAQEQGKDAATDTITAGWPEVKHLRQAWITQKLKNTRVYDRGQILKEPDPGSDDPNVKVGRPYDKLKMPTFYLTDEQVHAIVTFVLSNRSRLVSDTLWKKTTNEDAVKVARGRELVQRYNCVSCHVIETNKPQVQQYFKSDDVMVLAPPSLRGEGNKIQFNWLFDFFHNVVQMRPRIFTGIRMPSFPATDDEFSAIIAYFNSISNNESRDLKKELEPVLKYVNEQRAQTKGFESLGVGSEKATTQPTKLPDPSKPWPGDDWITRNEFAGAMRELHDWALEFNQLNASQLDPKQKPEDLQRNYRLALARAAFVMELYNAPYPFVEATTPEISDERFKLGEQFFYQLQCLSCHVIGDPSIEGANKNPTAPNLSLAHLRLQRRWVRHWVQEPDIIQKGTAMPPFFTGLPIYTTITPDGKAPLGQSQPRAQNVPDPKATEIEEKYGKNVQEQTTLLLDFVYAAGARGYTAKQPATPAQAKPATRPTTKSASAQ